MKLTKIGAGWNTTSKTGRNYISINLDLEVFSKVYKEDYKKICMFKNSYKETKEQPDFIIMCPAKEDEPTTNKLG